MPETTQQQTVTTETPARGFGYLPCPKCGEEGVVTLQLDDLSTCTCAECEAEFSTDEVLDFIAKWQAVLNWIGQAPQL